MQDLKTYKDTYNGLRLDYNGTTFVDPGTDNATMYAIRYTSDETSQKVVKSVRSTDLDNVSWKYPYTGTGFISSADELDLRKIPGTVVNEGNKVIPEYYSKTIKNVGSKISDGAEMYKITESGEEILYAVYDEIKEYFIVIGE